jgi:hypothetical protein
MNNIAACYLGSAQTQTGKVVEEIISGQMRYVKNELEDSKCVFKKNKNF